MEDTIAVEKRDSDGNLTIRYVVESRVKAMLEDGWVVKPDNPDAKIECPSMVQVVKPFYGDTMLSLDDALSGKRVELPANRSLARKEMQRLLDKKHGEGVYRAEL